MRICLKCNAPLKATGWNCDNCGWTPNSIGGIPLLAPYLAEGFPDYPLEAHCRCVYFEKTNFWFVCRNRLITYFLGYYFGNAKKLLEIGCGTGYVLAGISLLFPGMELCGAEAYPSALKYAKANLPKADLVQMNAYRLPFIREFNVVGAFDVLEHLSDDGVALKEMYKATVPGGGIILTVPQHPWMWSVLDDKAGHKRRYTRKELKNKVQKAGFEILHMTSFVSLLLPLMWISRMIKTRQNKSKETQSELNLPKPLNTAFKIICSFEVLLTQMGLSLPVGGSLLCVARKMDYN